MNHSIRLVAAGMMLTAALPAARAAANYPTQPVRLIVGFGPGGVSDILSVSRTGQLAISLRCRPVGYLRDRGTLAQVPIAGGAPRELLEDVEFADWHPDGRQIAVVRTVNGRTRLEFPIGKVLYRSTGWVSDPRVSPKSDQKPIRAPLSRISCQRRWTCGV